MYKTAAATRPTRRATHNRSDFLDLFPPDDRPYIERLFRNLSVAGPSPSALVERAIDRLQIAASRARDLTPEGADRHAAAKRAFRITFVNERLAIAYARFVLSARRSAR